jgi:hypothetical protein
MTTELYKIATKKAHWLKAIAKNARGQGRGVSMLPADVEAVAAIIEVLAGHIPPGERGVPDGN